MHPLLLSKALAFLRGMVEGVAQGERALWVEEDAEGMVGTVQVLGAALMQAAERRWASRGGVAQRCDQKQSD